MEELKQINAGIAKKQIGRIGFGVGSLILGVVLIGKYMYQSGITAQQMNIAKEFPEEYEAMTEKILKAFDETREL